MIVLTYFQMYLLIGIPIGMIVCLSAPRTKSFIFVASMSILLYLFWPITVLLICLRVIKYEGN